MRKIALVTVMTIATLALTACGKKDNNDTTSQAAVTTEASTEATTESTASVKDASDLLSQIFAAYNEDNQFPVGGGDENNMSYDGVGAFEVRDGVELDNMTGYPAADAALIDAAATGMHLMNANTFTAGAYHLVSTDDVAALAKRIEDNIQNRMWCCGFPDKLCVIQVGDYLISAFGEREIMDYFKNTTLSVFPNAVVLSEADIF